VTVDPGIVFGALADDTRRTVFVRVAASGQATASELARDLPVTRQAVAKHLSLLASAGLVESERVGRETRFHARGEPLRDAIDWMASVGARWDDRLARLAALADRSG
jgi:DNA-binding transcriptional ArsR family regulator